MGNVAIILAAGQGKRMALGYNKMFTLLVGKPVLEYDLEFFQNCPYIDQMILVGQDEELEYVREMFDVSRYSKLIAMVSGGAERQDSVHNGLAALPDDCQRVLIHDGARPLVTDEIVANVLNAITDTCGAIAAVPAKDTIKRVNDTQEVVETPNRSTLWMVQTPQGFSCAQIKAAHQRAQEEQFYSSDDAALVEHYGGTVKVVMGSYENLKITTPEDLIIVEALLRQKQREEQA